MRPASTVLIMQLSNSRAGLLPAAIFVRSDITVYRKFIVFIHEVWYNTKEQGLTAPRSAEDKGKEKQIT